MASCLVGHEGLDIGTVVAVEGDAEAKVVPDVHQSRSSEGQ